MNRVCRKRRRCWMGWNSQERRTGNKPDLLTCVLSRFHSFEFSDKRVHEHMFGGERLSTTRDDTIPFTSPIPLRGIALGSAFRPFFFACPGFVYLAYRSSA